MTNADENLLTHAPVGILSFNEEGLITNANAYCQKVLEFEKDELVGKSFSILLTISGRIFYQTHLYPLVKLHKHANEIFINLQSKTKKDVPVVLNAITGDVNGDEEIICSFIPVINRRKYEDEILLALKKAQDALQKNEVLIKIKNELLQQQETHEKQVTLLRFQNKELLQLSDIIAHDLQEPVRKLILFSHQLQENHLQPDKKDYALEVIKKSSQRIKNLLLSLQYYMDLTVKTPVEEEVNLNEIIQYELSQLQKVFAKIILRVNMNSLPNVNGDKKQLTLMFHHLLRNAFEHGVQANHLNLSINSVIIKENFFNALEDNYKYVDYLKITIKDNGPGFDPAYNNYVFEVLKKINLSADNIGFGLAFCKRIAENHFGNIQAEGSLCEGATFTVKLPIAEVFKA